jgi:hypothetical protein
MRNVIEPTKLNVFKTPIAKAALSGFMISALMAVLWVDLNHNHFQELQSNGECEICLKNGSSDDFIASSVSILFVSSFLAQEALLSSGFIASSSVNPSARAPPFA